MRFTPTIFSQLVEPLDRRRFDAIVERHDADAYDKSFRQLGPSDGVDLRPIERRSTPARARSQLGTPTPTPIITSVAARSRAPTLADANARRPVEAFAEVLTMVAGLTDRSTRSEAKKLLRLIDSTPIPLGKLFDWAKSNGRIRGMKAHVVYDPGRDLPRILDITDANVNDAQIGRTDRDRAGPHLCLRQGLLPLRLVERHCTRPSAFFVTRPKNNMGLTVETERQCGPSRGDGFTVIADEEVVFVEQRRFQARRPAAPHPRFCATRTERRSS